MFNNPFFDNMKTFMDPQNLMSNMSNMANMKNMPNMDMGNIANMVKKNTEVMSNMNQINTENMEAILRRNAEIAQKAANEAFNAMKDVASSNNPENAMSTQQQYMKKAFETAMSNVKELTEMVTKSSMEIFQIAGGKVTESMNECMKHAGHSPKKKSA